MGNAPSTAGSLSADGKRLLSLTESVEQLRNIPHMQPDSLAAQYPPNNRHMSLELVCKFNATSACRVSFFTLAKEDEDGTMHTFKPVLSLFCNAGALQDFPGEHHQHAIKLLEIQSHAKMYMNCCEGIYPIVVRVESFATRYSGYSLNQLPPAESPQMQGHLSKLNIHTTFARLQLRRTKWQVDVLEQHLWLKGVCYVLPDCSTLAQHKLHTTEASQPSPASLVVPAAIAPGLTFSPASLQVPKSKTVKPSKKNQIEHAGPRGLCMLCNQRPVQVTTAPCNHPCMCIPCAQRQVHKFPYCPRCSQGLERCIPLTTKAGTDSMGAA